MTYTRALEGVIILSCNMTHTAEHSILKTYIWKTKKSFIKVRMSVHVVMWSP